MSMKRLILFMLSMIASCFAKETIELNSRNIVTLRGPINGRTTSKLIEKLNLFDDNKINIFISSPGGSVLEGMRIIDQIQMLNNSGREINCICDYCASMAFITLQACPRRLSMDSSILMQHQMSLGVEGNYYNLQNYMKFIKLIGEKLDNLQAERLGLPKKKFIDLVINDWWVPGHSAKGFNIVDDTVYVKCHDELIKGTESMQIQTFFGSVNILYSKCPLIRDPRMVIIQNNMTDPMKLKEVLKPYIPRDFFENRLVISYI